MCMGRAEKRGTITWLRKTMKCDEGSVERYGGAQGMAEIMAGVREREVGEIVKSVIQDTYNNDANVREGKKGK